VGATLRPGADAKELGFDILLPRETIEIRTDRRSLMQILINLTTNAIKYTTSGGVRITVERTGSGAGDRSEIAFRVEDTGLGISAEDQPRLFRAFEQIHRGLADSGSGLGLHLSQRMARQLGGRIEVESESGKGSVFTLFLPES